MIKILIAENEEKLKDVIIQALSKQGYGVNTTINSGESVIQIANKGLLKDRVITLEDSLYKEKYGSVYRSVLEIIERSLIEHILERTEGNQLKAARILGINRNTMHTKIKKYGISPEVYKHSING